MMMPVPYTYKFIIRQVFKDFCLTMLASVILLFLCNLAVFLMWHCPFIS